jgi:acetoin utilization deacetylase AcuC-like enzyme
MTDVLRVHDWGYVRKLKDACAQLGSDESVVHNLDADTAISRGSLRAALKAAGSVCHAVDEVMAGRVRPTGLFPVGVAGHV